MPASMKPEKQGRYAEVFYGAATADLAADGQDAFEEKWAAKYTSNAPVWRRTRQEVIPFFAFDPAIRRIIYTTNAVESLNRVIRKSIKTRGSFPTEEAATGLIYPAVRNFEKAGRNVREWFAARSQFAIMFRNASMRDRIWNPLGQEQIHRVQDTPHLRRALRQPMLPM